MNQVDLTVEILMTLRHKDIKIISELFKKAHDNQILTPEILNNLQTDLILIVLPDPNAYEKDKEEDIKKFLYKLSEVLILYSAPIK